MKAKLLLAGAYYVGGAGLALVLGWAGLVWAAQVHAHRGGGHRGAGVRHSPLLGWLYKGLSVAAVSRLAGVLELLAAAKLLAGWPWPRAGGRGSGQPDIFFATSTFLLSTPGVLEKIDGLWVPGDTGGFLFEDLGLLAAALFCTAYALRQVPAVAQ